MIRHLAAAGAALALAGAASAAETPEPGTDAAKAEAARIIAAAQAQDLFEDATEGEVPRVRHLRSGLVCTFEPGARSNAITIFKVLPRGEDVGCTTSSQGILSTLYATRYSQRISARDALQGAVGAVRQRYPDAKPFVGQTANADIDRTRSPKAAEHLRARFTIELDGASLLTKVDLAQVGEWSIKQRTTGPLQPEMATDLYSEVKFTFVLLKLMDADGEGAPQ